LQVVLLKVLSQRDLPERKVNSKI